MKSLDRQLKEYRKQLMHDVGLTKEESSKIATLVAADIRFLPTDAKAEIHAASPVALNSRYDELLAFQAWKDISNALSPHPGITRAQVITQNYVCFVYLKDACFEVVARRTPKGSVASRCCSFLSTGAVRDFRNAFSHANWEYNSGFDGLDCWVLEDPRKPAKGMRHFTVSESDLSFWQTLARGVSYAAYEQLRGI